MCRSPRCVVRSWATLAPDSAAARVARICRHPHGHRAGDDGRPAASSRRIPIPGQRPPGGVRLIARRRRRIGRVSRGRPVRPITNGPAAWAMLPRPGTRGDPRGVCSEGATPRWSPGRGGRSTRCLARRPQVNASPIGRVPATTRSLIERRFCGQVPQGAWASWADRNDSYGLDHVRRPYRLEVHPRSCSSRPAMSRPGPYALAYTARPRPQCRAELTEPPSRATSDVRVVFEQRDNWTPVRVDPRGAYRRVRAWSCATSSRSTHHAPSRAGGPARGARPQAHLLEGEDTVPRDRRDRAWTAPYARLETTWARAGAVRWSGYSGAIVCPTAGW